MQNGGMEQHKDSFDRDAINGVIRNSLSCLHSIYAASRALKHDYHLQSQASIDSERRALAEEYSREIEIARRAILGQMPPAIMVSGPIEVFDGEDNQEMRHVESGLFEVAGVEIGRNGSQRLELSLRLHDGSDDSGVSYRWRYKDEEWALPEQEY